MLKRRMTLSEFNFYNMIKIKKKSVFSKGFLFFLGIALGMICLLSQMNIARAACFLSYDQARTIKQGDGLIRINLQGGKEGLGTSLEGKLGLLGNRGLHLRSGTCQRSNLWGWGVEAGLNQHWLSQEETGWVDLGYRLTTMIFFADDEDSSHSEIGFQPVFLISYPFILGLDESRTGYVSLGLGMTTYFIDQRQHHIIDEGADQIEKINLNSSVEWQPLVSVTTSLDILPFVPLALELRWQQGGLYGGGSVAYQF